VFSCTTHVQRKHSKTPSREQGGGMIGGITILSNGLKAELVTLEGGADGIAVRKELDGHLDQCI